MKTEDTHIDEVTAALIGIRAGMDPIAQPVPTAAAENNCSREPITAEKWRHRKFITQFNQAGREKSSLRPGSVSRGVSVNLRPATLHLNFTFTHKASREPHQSHSDTLMLLPSFFVVFFYNFP